MDMLELFLRLLPTSADNMWAMMKSGGTELVIDRQAVCDHCCSRFDIVLNKRLNGLPVNSRNTAKADSSESLLRITFYRNKNQRLAFCSPSPGSFFLSPYIGLIHFHPAHQAFPTHANHHATEFLQPAPSGLVAPELVAVAQILGAQACLLSHHQPHDVKPQTQRLAAILKHRAHCHRTLSPARSTVPQLTISAPHLRAATARTRETFGPSNPLQVRCTVLLGGKPVQELLEVPRIRVLDRRFHGTRKHYMLWPLESISHPVSKMSFDSAQINHKVTKVL